MAQFRKVNVTIKFSLSMTMDNEFSEVVGMLDREQWQFLIEMAAKRNMSASRPEVSAQSTSADDE